MNTFAPNVRAAKYIEQILTDLEAEMESNPVRVGDFNAPVAVMDRTSGQEVSKDTADLSSTRAR